MNLPYLHISAADGTTKVVSGPTSILPKTAQTQASNQLQSLIRVAQTGKFIYHMNPCSFKILSRYIPNFDIYDLPLLRFITIIIYTMHYQKFILNAII